MVHNKSMIAARVVFVLYLSAVIYLCFGHFDNLPSVRDDIFGIPTDKVVHFCMFFPFVTLSYFAAGMKLKSIWLTILLIAALFILGSVIAAATEIGQGLVGYRSMDPADFRADALSLMIGSVITLFIDIRRRVRK